MSLTFDLDKPAAVVGSGKNADKFTLFLVKQGIQPAAIQANENAVTGNDLYLKIGPQPGDASGNVKFDWSSKANDLKNKFKDAETKATAVLLATSKPGNEHPDMKVAVGQDAVIKLGASFDVTPLRPFVSANDWVHYHHPLCFFELVVHGPLKNLTIDVTPKEGGGKMVAMFALWEKAEGGPVAWMPKKLVLGSAGNMPGGNCNSAKCKIPTSFHNNGAWWNGTPGFWGGFHDITVEAGVKYVIGFYPRMAGTSTAKITGKAPYANLQKTVTFGMQGAHPSPGD